MSAPRWQLDWYNTGNGTARVRLIRLSLRGGLNRVVLRGEMPMSDLIALKQDLDPVFSIQLISSFKDGRRKRNGS